MCTDSMPDSPGQKSTLEEHMERLTTTISQADIDRQLSFCRAIAARNAERPQPPLPFVDT